MIGIIGAGISGLSTAFHLQKNNIPYILFEKSSQVGGNIQTLKKNGYLLELGANSILCDTEIMNFLSKVGLADEILLAKPVSKSRYIFKNGRYQDLPTHPLKLLFSGFFSWKTKLAIFRERNLKSISPENETLGAFFERRFSKEIVDNALDPFISGIYAGNPYELLVSKTFPNLLGFEKKYGSVLKGFIKQGSSKRKQSLSFKNGMASLPATIASQLTGLQLNTSVETVTKTENGYLLQTGGQSFACEKLVIACEIFVTARLLENLFPEFVEKLRQINYAPMVAVHTVYKRNEVKHPLNGFGGLNPKVENQFSLGSIWSSSVFDGRCSQDEVLFTTFVGGTQQLEKTQISDEFIKNNIHQELKKNYHIDSENPEFQHIFRWEKALPQYNLNVLPTYKIIEKLQSENIYICTNWYGGVSLSDCIKKGKNIIDRLNN
ncbi:MAG: protoporphyrinogen oxidase [Verrucomicrobia bacterium]|nr:protoporphyrinogen oxidase [Cytophagales bacterium]